MPSDTMPLLEQRAEELLGDRAIVWEGDAATFQFSYIGRAAEVLLGYPASRWTTEPAFWAETVVHPEDRDDAVAYCALATGQARDHDFVYRAIAADGRVVWLHDMVKVLRGLRGVPERLRGIMIDVTESVGQGAVASSPR
jgi:PAS domain S-box-containing protein